MKIIVSYWSKNSIDVKASTVKAKLIELGLQPLSVRKRKIKHVFNHWFVELPETILGTCEGVDEARAKAYPSLYCVNFISINDHTTPFHPNEVRYLHKTQEGKNSDWDITLDVIKDFFKKHKGGE